MAGPDPVGAIMDQVVSLLEGRSGYSGPHCDRSIARGRFRHVDITVENAGPQGGAEPRFPFMITDLGYAGTEGTPTDATCGDYLYGNQRLAIEIGYGYRPKRELELSRQMSWDERDIINTLVAEQNQALVDGWCGCEVVGSSTVEAGEGDPAPVRIRVIELIVNYRYYRGI